MKTLFAASRPREMTHTKSTYAESDSVDAKYCDSRSSTPRSLVESGTLFLLRNFSVARSLHFVAQSICARIFASECRKPKLASRNMETDKPEHSARLVTRIAITITLNSPSRRKMCSAIIFSIHLRLAGRGGGMLRVSGPLHIGTIEAFANE